MEAMIRLIKTALGDLRNRAMRWIRSLMQRVDLMTEDWRELNWSDTDKLKEYAKANMSEGYLSDEEDSFLNELFAELSRHRAVEKDLAEFVNDVQYYKVN